MRLEFSLALPRSDVAIGVAAVQGVACAPASAALRSAIEACVEARRAPLGPGLETRRLACRGMLRNGTYKPTGRAKPASEYLLRSANEGSFPSINGLVDAGNLVSLEHMVPISVWDVDLAGTERFQFRLGGADEGYVFNAGGQRMDLCDLIVGCGIGDGDAAQLPMVTPVKDSLRTKTTASTRRVAAAVFCPLSGDLGVQDVGRIATELLTWLLASGDGSQGAAGVLLPNSELALDTEG